MQPRAVRCRHVQSEHWINQFSRLPNLPLWPLLSVAKFEPDPVFSRLLQRRHRFDFFSCLHDLPQRKLLSFSSMHYRAVQWRNVQSAYDAANISGMFAMRRRHVEHERREQLHQLQPRHELARRRALHRLPQLHRWHFCRNHRKNFLLSVRLRHVLDECRRNFVGRVHLLRLSHAHVHPRRRRLLQVLHTHAHAFRHAREFRDHLALCDRHRVALRLRNDFAVNERA